MNPYDDEAYDHKMEEIAASLEVFILDVIRSAVKRPHDNNADLLQDAPNRNQDDCF